MNIGIALLATATACVVAAPAIAQPTPPVAKPTCFYATQFEGWKAPPEATAIYIRVLPQRYYRLDLTSPCYALRDPASHLVTRFHGTDTICSAIDWDLKVVSSPGGIPEACIVKTMTQLSPAEVDAIPKGFKP